MNGTWRAQGFTAWAERGFRLVVVACLLGGCSMFDSKPTPGEAAATGQPYPNLGTVPSQAPPTSTPADRAQVTQGLVADQQNAAYSNDQLKAQPPAGSVPPPPAAQPPAAPTSTEAAAGTAPTTTTAAAATPPASGTVPASPSVEQSTLPPPPNTTQTASTAPATVPYGTPMPAAPATVPYGTPMPAAPAQPAADVAHYASPYYPLPVVGAPAPYAPAPGQAAPVQMASAQLPASAAPIDIQDQAKLASILGAGAATLPGQGTPATGVQQPPIAVIFFRNGSTGLSSHDYAVLHDVMLIQQQQGGHLRVVGHASERTETVDYVTHQAINNNLSLKRASAVGGALLQMGVPGADVAISAVGGQAPIFYEFMPTGEAGNRRVEIFLDR
jgi:outer membrane protein OmpA-like peptidoglycan-associated protein